MFLKKEKQNVIIVVAIIITECVGLNTNSIIAYYLCDIGQITHSLCFVILKQGACEMA